MIETALHAHLVARGAHHADDHGVALPRHFGDAEAEQYVLDTHPASLVVRTSAFFGPWDSYNFIAVLLRTPTDTLFRRGFRDRR